VSEKSKGTDRDVIISGTDGGENSQKRTQTPRGKEKGELGGESPIYEESSETRRVGTQRFTTTPGPWFNTAQKISQGCGHRQHPTSTKFWFLQGRPALGLTRVSSGRLGGEHRENKRGKKTDTGSVRLVTCAMGLVGQETYLSSLNEKMPRTSENF